MISPNAATYWHYLQQLCPTIALADLPSLKTVFETTSWDDPQTPLDWNNCGVVALVEAQKSVDLELRRVYLDMAIAAFDQGANEHPLCAAHLSLAYCLVGEAAIAGQIALSNFTQTLQAVHTQLAPAPLGLIYLPIVGSAMDAALPLRLLPMLQADNSAAQAFLLLGDVLGYQLQTMFYNEIGLRFLHLAADLSPRSTHTNFLLGIANYINGKWEGLLYLHRANQLMPGHAAILQALYLAYRDRGELAAAAVWLETARTARLQAKDRVEWRWASLDSDRPFTYVPYDGMQLAIRASLLNITTGVLLAQADWFEAEIEFWRNQIQPGMTVVDVGANVGVYTFSAAQRVGSQGRVIAVEPFSACVLCLQETCAVNQLSWVTVIAGAASDRAHTAYLALQSASELNRLVAADGVSPDSQSVEAVACFALDQLLEEGTIAQVDFLKIDAEGHEMQVLAGSDRLLAECQPTILYENIDAGDAANLAVADLLQSKGYRLFRYVPFIQSLVPIQAITELQGNLNIIAVPAGREVV